MSSCSSTEEVSNQYSIYYKKLIDPINEDNLEIQKRLIRHKQWELGTAYPFLLNIYKEYADGKVTLRFFSKHVTVLLLNEDINVSMALISSLSFAKKVDVIKSIAPFKFRYKDLCDSLDELIKQLTLAEELRNQILHGTWMQSTVEDNVAFHKPTTSRKHGMKGGMRFITTKEVEDTISIIQKAKSAVCKIGGELTRRKVINIKFFQIDQKTEAR